MQLNSKDKLWDFEVVINENFKNINHIHPLKQKDVLQIVKYAEETSDIEAVVVFGSAVRFDCNSFSDLDILVEKKTKTFDFDISDKIDSDVDVIFGWRADEKLLKEIQNTGVLVYCKEE